MEHFKQWIMKHKALAAGGGLALVVLLYLLLKGSASQPPSGGSALNAYYAAQAAGAGDTASTAESANALQASTNQTNAAEAVGLAQVAASTKPYEAQLAAITTQANLAAYQDYLSELGHPTYDAALFTDPTTGKQYVQTAEQVAAGDRTNLIDAATGLTVAASSTSVTPSTAFTHGTYNATTNTFTAQNKSTPLTFNQFNAANAA